MADKKPGQNIRSGESANVSRENTPAAKDGPEEYTEDFSIGGTEDGKLKAPYADSADTSSASKAKNYSKQKIATGILGRYTFPNSPMTVKNPLGLKPSRFGSPFAYSAHENKHDFFKGLLAESTRDLFDQVVADASNLREHLLSDVALTDDGSNGQFCVLKKCESSSTDSDSGEETNSDDSKLVLYGFEANEDRLKLDLFVVSASAAVHRTHVVRNDLIGSASSSDASSTTGENTKDDGAIDVRRVQNLKSGETEYFVTKKGLDFLSINGIDVDPTVRAGPLPDFAVFELGHSSVFWWRTAAALDYMPSLKRKRESEDVDEDSSKKACKNGTDPSPNLQVFPESKNWLDEYRRRVRFCEERPITYRSSITDLHPPHQLPDGEMRNIDVILAIGAVWRGLLAKADFAYANSDLFSLARDMRMVGKYAVNGSNHFIMPLLFNEESPTLGPEPEEDTAEPLEPVFSAFQRGGAEKNQREIAAGKKSKQTNSGNRNNSPLSIEDEKVQSPEHKGGIGHFVLAIAEKVKRDDSSIMKDLKTKGSLVRLRFMDSAKETIDRTTIRRVARNIVRHSGWLGDNWPCFDANQEHWTGVLRQSGNRSGEHTVMNAWAYMLDIQLASTRERGLGHIFYKEVRKLILLALRGQLDSLTIRAFMQHTKYAIDQPLSHFRQTQIQQPDLPNPLMNTKTVALNEDAFNKILRKLDEQGPRYANIWRDMPVPPNGATTQQSGSAPNVVSEPTLSHTSQDPFAGPSGISASSANLPPVATRTWQESLDQGLVYHKALKAKNPRKTKDTSKPASKIDSSSAMADDEMILAIASIWEGLKRLDRAEYDFTYAGMDVFAPWGKEQVIGAVGGRNRFIMPLLLSSVKPGTLENQGNGKKKIDELGHLVLCVAELVGDDPLTIQITVFDSIGHNWYHHSTWDTATAIIKSSGWLGADIDWGLVNWRHPSYTPVPRQVGDNTCGLHVIFNAWATMLGIPIHSGPLRIRQSGKSEDEYYNEIFLQEGLEIVNLALGGFMDSATIQAFFNVHGYSVEQRFDDPARAVIPVNAVGMNHEKFRRTLLKYHWSDKLTSAEFRGTTFPEATITRLVDLGLDREQAWRALLISGGNLEEAANWHHYPEPPEEALSPKTPDRG